jgi:hypothetical protein
MSSAARPSTSTSFQLVAQFNNSTFAATAAIADNDIWAVGSSTSNGTQEPLAVHFDGTSWSIVTTPALPKGGSFADLTAVATNDVWAVGLQNTGSSINTLIEHWNGASWGLVSGPTLPNGAYLSAVAAVSPNNVWAAGDVNVSKEGILVEHWDGSSWSILSSPSFAGVGPIYDISADASNGVWAAGNASTISGAPFSGPAFLNFDGMSWRLINPHMPVDVSSFGSVTALSPTNVWAVGTVQVGSHHRSFNKAAIEHGDGTSWSIVSSPSPPSLPSSLRGMAAISANDIWAVGFFAGLGGFETLAEHWDGKSWTIISSPNPGNHSNALFGVSTLSDGTVAAIGFHQDRTSDAVLLIMRN